MENPNLKIPGSLGLLNWGELWGSNPRPSEPQPDALTN